MNNFEHNFPFDLLPKAGDFPLPKFQAAVQECINHRKVSVKMPYFVAAAACSAAAQNLVDVEIPSIGTVGTSLYVLVGAVSGEGKTAVRRDFFAALDEVNSEIKGHFYQAETQYQEQHHRWKVEDQGLATEHAVAARKGMCLEAIQARRNEHYHRKPVKPRPLSLSMKEPNHASLLLALTNFPCSTIVSGDCAKYLRSTILQCDTMLCDIWSHELIDEPRVSVESYYRENPRLAMLLLIQPSKLAAILKTSLGLSGLDSGLFARMVYCNAEGSRSGRFLDTDAAATPVGTSCRDEFKRNLKEILRDGANAMSLPGYARSVLRFGKEAANLWICYYNFVQEQRGSGGRYGNAREYATRLPEQVARMSAAFHLAERFNGNEIGMECLLSAIAICDESSKDYVSTFVREDEMELAARRLYDWLRERLRDEPARTGQRIAKHHDFRYVRTLSQLAPERGMRGKNIHPLLAILERDNLVRTWFQRLGRGQMVEMFKLLESPSQ